ncbi:MAG: O-antigen ligase family protein [Candidatus Aminicenantia bacterium]
MSETFFFASFFACIALILRRKRRFIFPSLFLPLIAYSIFTIISTFFSLDFLTSLKDIKELLLFLIVPVIFNSSHEEWSFSSFNYALSFSIILSFIVSLAQSSGMLFPKERASGFLGHYMTQSGVLLLSSIISFSMILGEKNFKKIYWAFIFSISISISSLTLTLTRNAWIGTFFGISLILILFRPKLMILTVPILVIIFLVSPSNVKNRFFSIFDPNDETNRDRIHMGIAGLKIISKYPFFGSGPDTVKLIYKDYKPENAVRNNPHLHNNILQIIAERGIFALLSWFWFILVAFKDNLKVFRKSKSRFFKFSALGGTGAIIAFFVSGLFEYNFGDSEVKMLFLYLITYPLVSLKILKEEKNEN